MRRFALLMAALLAVGCTDSRHYDVTGVVLKASTDGQLMVSHDPVPGYMDAMVMPFTLRSSGEAATVAPGDRIGFRLTVTATRSYIDRLRVLTPARTDAGMLRSPTRSTLVPVGAPVPEFRLIDQHGQQRELSALRGQAVVITFIYTRCPLPDYCPRMMLNFREISERLEGRLGRDVTLLTITFDPRHDTREVLERYARFFNVRGPGWHLLTGSTDEIQKVTEAFGIEFWPEEGLFTHNLQTAVLDAQGRLFGTLEGKEYSVQQLADLIDAALGAR